MKDDDMKDKETEEGAEELSQDKLNPRKQQGLFGNSGIQLSSDELVSPVTLKFLRHINGQQENEIQKLKAFEGQFFDKRQECEVLKKEKEGIQKELNSKKQIDNIQKLMITTGSLLLGTLKFMTNLDTFLLILVATVASALIIGGVFPVFNIGSSK